MQKCLIVYNSKNKNSYFRINSHKLVEYLSHNSYDITIRATIARHDIYNIIKDEDNYDLLCVSGGDGTIHETINAIAEFKNKPKVLYFPAGSVNDFGRTLKMKHSVDYGIELLEKGFTKKMDICKINDTYFTYVCAFGPFTATSYNASHKLKNKIGASAYFVDAFKDIPKMKKGLKLKLIVNDNEKIEGEFVFGLVSNSSSIVKYKNFFKENKIDDGVYEMLFIKKGYTKKLKSISSIIANFGVTKKVDTDVYVYRKVSKLKVICDEDVKWMIDGEKGPHGTVELDVINNHIDIYCQEDKSEII